ncbi:SoxR reducing system RseC family protein [Treponema pectinovorum]|uniref:SoxR reducing system RseC family protein n=1 Tax=Treponema pectinovorum TaxID=164 RepID=UPI0011C774FF|nr:SoxR reducing system RseC family protein [Treponema pectinovorum]
MRNLARVIKIKDETKTATVLPLFSSACINCLSTLKCSKNLKVIEATNKKDLKLSEGDIVKIELPLFFKISTGIAALFFPIGVAILGYFLSPIFYNIINLQTTELLRFAFSAFFLLFAELLVFLFSRVNIDFVSPEITQIL